MNEKFEVNVIKKKSSVEDRKKLSKLFFYLQDISFEIQSCYRIMQSVESTLDVLVPKGTEASNDFKETFTFKILTNNDQVIKIMSKIALQTTILGVCRIAEVINNPELILLLEKYCPNSYKRLDNIIGKRYTFYLKKYRNQYAAHPLNNKNDDFLSLAQIEKLLAKILDIKDFSKVKYIEIFNYVSTLHHPDLKDPELSISWAIRYMSDELKGNGIDPDKEKRD